MPETVEATITKIYENTSLTVKARVEAVYKNAIEDITFKFVKNGEILEEGSVPISEGKSEGGEVVVSYSLKAPAVADDEDCYYLDYHYFYSFKNADETSEAMQSFPSSRVQVFPRLAQLKAVDKEGNAFSNFCFTIVQGGEFSEVFKTVSADTANAAGETIPAGSCEFNLGLFPDFKIAAAPPYEVLEETVAEGRSREIKGDMGFRAVFLGPEPQGRKVKQYVDSTVERLGREGKGHQITVEVSAHPEELAGIVEDPNAVVHFRVTYGPDAGEPAEKSARDDADNPTKVTGDDSVTAEEKEAKKKYEGSVKLSDGTGEFVLELGKAGGDSCKVEIAGSKTFLTDESIDADQVIEFQNWRQVNYELMVPDLMLGKTADPSSLESSVERQLAAVGRQLFVEFTHQGTHVFDAQACADEGTLVPGRFLGEGAPARTHYLLSGRNWRELPKDQAWASEDPRKTVEVLLCDQLLKWRKDTQDESAGTKDFSGTLDKATGSIDMTERFEGLFLPFSGHDSGDGIESIEWTADISSADGAKFDPSLTIEDVRHEGSLGDTLVIAVSTPSSLNASPERIEFKRPSYPKLRVKEVGEATADQADDGKVTIKEVELGKELSLTFETIPEETTDEDADPTEITDDHEDQLIDFFESLFADNKDALRADKKSNRFQIEVHGQGGPDGRTRRLEAAAWAVKCAYDQTKSADGHSFSKDDFGDAEAAQIQSFVDALLADKISLAALEGEVPARVSGPADSELGEDDCFNAVKDKLQELFDATKEEFTHHPGLDGSGEPRTGALSLREATDVSQTTTAEWHFVLPDRLANGEPGPGSFIGAEKTQETCPVKVAFSVQAHEESTGEVDGTLIAWPTGQRVEPLQLVRLILRALDQKEDAAKIAHTHGDDGNPGDCLEDSASLCDDCVKHGRSLDLTSL
jgi:hypothetical protein